MGILDFPKRLLGKSVSRGSILSAVGSYAIGALLSRSRTKWEAARAQDPASQFLDNITANDIARGAGKLLKHWLRFQNPAITNAQAEDRLKHLLAEMDPDDNLPEERARSRFLVSKALFFLEGFKLSHCRYEAFQQEALALLRKNPELRNLKRNALFQGIPFAPESLIATTHRMLLMLDNGQLDLFIDQALQRMPLRDDADYMALLIMLTLQADLNGEASDTSLEAVIVAWFDDYCAFKIQQTHQQEAFLNTSISTATGGLPAEVGMHLLKRTGRSFFSAKKRK